MAANSKIDYLLARHKGELPGASWSPLLGCSQYDDDGQIREGCLLAALRQLGGAALIRQLAAACDSAASGCDPGKAGGDPHSRRWERAADHLRAAAAAVATGEQRSVTLADAAEVLEGEA